MSEESFQELLDVLLESNEEVKSVSSFKDNGVLTSNKGLVVRLKDGTEIQLTIVKSK